MVLHVQISINYGVGCFKNKTKYFLYTNSHFFSGVTTAQTVDPLPLYRELPALPLTALLLPSDCTKGLLSYYKKYFC
jgi:hypothetical protein